MKSFYKKDAHPGRKFRDFHDWLLNFAKVDEIFFENVPHYESMHAAKVYCGFLAIMQTFAEDAGIKCTGIFPTSVKKIFCGKGRADKTKMCEHAHHLGWTGGKPGTDQHHDEADACAIYYAVMHKRGIHVTFAPQEG